MKLSVLFVCFLTQIELNIASPINSGCPNDAYDFIIVGGGTAGVALATRLSQELPEDKILLIEAGPTALDEPRINVPGRKGSTLGSVYDWNYTTVPQASADNRIIPVQRGKVLGGTSALNLMVWDRASDTEYDSWEQLGNPTWNWKTMIKYMLKVEKFTGAGTDTYGFKGVATGGPIQSVINRYKTAHIAAFLPAGHSAGIPYNLESLGGNPIGVMWQPTNIDPDGYVRSYSANAYLPLAGSNLKVLDRTNVDSVVFRRGKGHGLVGTGVRLESGAFIAARKEVILSAGVIGTPTILERSGIGQRALLESLGIKVLKELPGVGENYQDHLRVSNAFQLKDNYTGLDAIRFNSSFSDEQAQLYYQNKLSLYGSTAVAYIFANWEQSFGQKVAARLSTLAESALARFPSDKVNQLKFSWLSNTTANRVPQLEVIASDGYSGPRGYPPANSTLYGKQFFTLFGGLMHSFSRGSVHINSTSASAKPLIDVGYIANEYELVALVEAIKYNRRLASTYPLSETVEAEYEPGPAVQTDEQLREYVRATVLSIYHPAGTAAMKPEDDGGVLDPKLIVYGTSNLRVADASVYPLLPAAHPQTGIYAIAERASDFIAGQWAAQR